MRSLLVLASFGAAAASDDTVLVGQPFMTPLPVDPMAGSNGWSLVSHGVAEKLFTVNTDGEIVPQVAQSVSKVSDLVWDVDLKADYHFSDGTEVTAQLVADCLNELNAANDATSSSVGDIVATVPCDGTVRIETTKATHVMDAVLADWVFVVYKKDGVDYVFTGPYKIDAFVAGVLSPAVVAVASRSCSTLISALAASSSSACCFVRRFGRALVSSSAPFFFASMPMLARISSRVRAPLKIELLALVGAVMAVRGASFRRGRSLGGSEASAIADMF